MSRPDLIPSRGAIAEPLVLEVTRELTPSDLRRLGDAPKTSVPILQRLRATHHRQAQLLAEGRSVNEVAVIVGCTTQRLVQLQVDPAFNELISYYQDQIMSAMIADAARLKDKIIDVGEMAVDELRDRLEDDDRRRGVSIGENPQNRRICYGPNRSAAKSRSSANASTRGDNDQLRYRAATYGSYRSRRH